jgi:hypothetical protein
MDTAIDGHQLAGSATAHEAIAASLRSPLLPQAIRR